MKKEFYGMIVFGLVALIGPLLGLLMRGVDFFYDLVFLLWPAQPLAVIEASIGSFLATSLAIVVNVVIFSVVGLLVGAIVKKTQWLIALYGVVAALILLLALWGSGFSAAHFSWLAFVVALAVYATPFWLVARRS